MTGKAAYERFKELFPYLAPNATKYKANKQEGGVDVIMDNGTVFNFKIEGRNQWTLKRVS